MLPSQIRAFLRLNGYTESDARVLTSWAIGLTDASSRAWDELVLGTGITEAQALATSFAATMRLDMSPAELLVELSDQYGPTGALILLILAQDDSRAVAEYVATGTRDVLPILRQAVLPAPQRGGMA